MKRNPKSLQTLFFSLSSSIRKTKWIKYLRLSQRCVCMCMTNTVHSEHKTLHYITYSYGYRRNISKAKHKWEREYAYTAVRWFKLYFHFNYTAFGCCKNERLTICSTAFTSLLITKSVLSILKYARAAHSCAIFIVDILSRLRLYYSAIDVLLPLQQYALRLLRASARFEMCVCV